MDLIKITKKKYPIEIDLLYATKKILQVNKFIKKKIVIYIKKLYLFLRKV